VFPFHVQNAEGHDAPAAAAMEKFAMKIYRFILQFMFANSAAAARIPSGFEFIRNEESRNAGAKPVHGFMGSLLKQRFVQRLLTSSPTVITNGFAGVWFRPEKPLRFRAGPAGAAQARPARENRADER
jgi:hypothetical protein